MIAATNITKPAYNRKGGQFIISIIPHHASTSPSDDRPKSQLPRAALPGERFHRVEDHRRSAPFQCTERCQHHRRRSWPISSVSDVSDNSVPEFFASTDLRPLIGPPTPHTIFSELPAVHARVSLMRTVTLWRPKGPRGARARPDLRMAGSATRLPDRPDVFYHAAERQDYTTSIY